jgi:hypothetical protein
MNNSKLGLSAFSLGSRATLRAWQAVWCVGLVSCLFCAGCNKEPTSSSANSQRAPTQDQAKPPQAQAPNLQPFQKPAAPQQTAGARIEGTIQLGKKVKYPVKLSAGFVGKDAKGEPVGPAVGFPVDSIQEGATQSVSNDTWKPLRATLEFDAGKGWSYKHDGLLPGTYLVYVQWGNHYFDAKWVTVKDASATIKLPLVIDSDLAGKLEIRLPKSDKETLVAYVPLDEQGMVPLSDVPMENWFEGKLTVKEPKVVLDNVRAGKYRVKAFPPSGKPLSGDVEVTAGGTAQIELKENK